MLSKSQKRNMRRTRAKKEKRCHDALDEAFSWAVENVSGRKFWWYRDTIRLFEGQSLTYGPVTVKAQGSGCYEFSVAKEVPCELHQDHRLDVNLRCNPFGNGGLHHYIDGQYKGWTFW